VELFPPRSQRGGLGMAEPPSHSHAALYSDQSPQQLSQHPARAASGNANTPNTKETKMQLKCWLKIFIERHPPVAVSPFIVRAREPTRH
jgi:hypothetical protein